MDVGPRNRRRRDSVGREIKLRNAAVDDVGAQVLVECGDAKNAGIAEIMFVTDFKLVGLEWRKLWIAAATAGVPVGTGVDAA